MIERRWGNYPGGAAQAIAGNVHAMQTGEGESCGFPMLRFDDETAESVRRVSERA